MPADATAAATVGVVGGTGRLGRAVVADLLREGHRPIVISRNPAGGGASIAPAVEARVGDLTNPGTLPAACRGADVLIASVHGMLGRGRYRSERVDDAGHRALIDAARAAGIRHVVYISVLGASAAHPVDFWRTKYRVEEYLKASGLAWTILRPAAFMELHAVELIGRPILAGRTAHILGRGDQSISYVAVRDVARLAARAVTDAELRNAVVEIGGPEPITPNEVAARFGRIAGGPVSVRHVPPAAVRTLAALIAPLHPGIARVMRASLAGEIVDHPFDAAASAAALGLTLTPLEEVAREQAASVMGAGGPRGS